MSTRCQIGFYGGAKVVIGKPEALVYRHSDGYPSGVLPDIMPFLAWWAKGRGISDIEYVSARLLQYLCNEYDGRGSQWASEEEKASVKQFTGTLGHGISANFHGDIEYVYAIHAEGVRVYEVRGAWELPIEKRVKLIGRIPYEEYELSSDYQRLAAR